MNSVKFSIGLVILTLVFVFLGVMPILLSAENYANWRENWWSAFPLALSALLSMFLLPLLVIKKFFKEDLKDYGFRLPVDYKKAVMLTVVTIAILLPFLVFMSGQESFQIYYSAAAGLTLGQFLLVGVAASLIYYAAEEFLFRGFFFWGLWRRIGYHSFWVNAVVFASLHLTKPFMEVIFAFLASLIFSFLALKTRSFLPAAVVHFVIALVLNILVIFSANDSVLNDNIFFF